MDRIKNKIIYWGFLVLGFVGILIQMYQLFNNSLILTANQAVVTIIFITFIFRPKILLEIAKIIMNKLQKNAK